MRSVTAESGKKLLPPVHSAASSLNTPVGQLGLTLTNNQSRVKDGAVETQFCTMFRSREEFLLSSVEKSAERYVAVVGLLWHINTPCLTECSDNSVHSVQRSRMIRTI